MHFFEKLDFLMNITKTSNCQLARAVNLDASYISRLRSGKRFMPRNAGVITGISGAIARHPADELQKKAICDALRLSCYPEDADKFSAEIAMWLSKENESINERVEHFLTGLAGIGVRSQMPSGQKEPEVPDLHEAVSVFYGIEGKRRAAEVFLTLVAVNPEPETLLLFSDEETSWMTADRAYTQRWAMLMMRVLARGNRIKIIHTVSRDLDEMLSAISQWMPLYMSGLIEPYFYPKKRDGIFRNTLFIAPGCAAVVSGSVGGQVGVAANLLFRDQKAIESYTEEFRQYFKFCRPLMKIYTQRDSKAYMNKLVEFEDKQADTLLKTESLSLVTMPETLLQPILERYRQDRQSEAAILTWRQQNFGKFTSDNRYDEIIALPDIFTLKNRQVKVAMSDMLGGGAIYYTPGEYAEHLENIIRLLSSRENFRVHLIKRPVEDRYMVYAREETGVIVAKTSQPPVVLYMDEANMTAALWDFLINIIGEWETTDENYDRKSVIDRLTAFLDQLKQEL